MVLTRNVPSENLKKSDVATLVDYLEHPSGGESIPIATVPVSAIASLTDDYMSAARPIHETA